MNREFLIEEQIIKANGEIGRKTYRKGRLLGKGGFAQVFEFHCLETNSVSAAKLIPKSELSKARSRQKLLSEIKLHRSLHHKNIVQFEHFFEDQNFVYILLELCENQTLIEVMRRRVVLTEVEVLTLIHQLTEALQYLHSHWIIHRDIKLGNLFLNSQLELKIGDFGLASKLEFQGERKRSFCGTPNFIAPEILTKHGYSLEVDVWSIGVLTYILLYGVSPFESADANETYKRILNLNFEFPEEPSVSTAMKDLITSILVIDPAERLSLDGIRSHPAFNTPFPRYLPLSSLAVPPSSSYLKKLNKECSIKSGREHDRELQDSHRRIDVSESPRSEIGSARGSERRTVLSSNFAPPQPMIWVKKWVDCSNKYGLGYLLSNNCAGVYFNDASKAIVNSGKNSFSYFGKNNTKAQEFSFTDYPDELRKKANLVIYFRDHLKLSKPICKEEGVYVKNWINNANASIFRFNNRTLQVRFHDRTEMVISGENVFYVNRRGENTTVLKNDVEERETPDIAKRYMYVKELLTTLFNKNQS